MEETEYEVPEEAVTVDAPQVPSVAKPWSWDTKTLVIAAVVVAAAGFGIWFLMSGSAAKRAFEEAQNAAAQS